MYYILKYVFDPLLSNMIHVIYFSGRAPAGLTLDRVEADGYGLNNPLPMEHGHAVTVPGAAAALVDTFHTHGSGKVIEI